MLKMNSVVSVVLSGVIALAEVQGMDMPPHVDNHRGPQPVLVLTSACSGGAIKKPARTEPRLLMSSPHALLRNNGNVDESNCCGILRVGSRLVIPPPLMNMPSPLNSGALAGNPLPGRLKVASLTSQDCSQGRMRFPRSARS